MPNTFAPFGFSQYSGTGSVPTYEQTQAAIAPSNTTPIFSGDPVVQATNATTGVGTGYIAQAPVTAQALAISGFTLSNGIVTATFTSTTAPQVGAYLVLNGLTTATTLNGAWQILTATATTATFAYSGAALTTQATTGYVFAPVAGIFEGCKYLSVSQKRTVWSNYWPGSDANTAAAVTAYVITDPNAQFLVQTANSAATATAVGLASVGQNIGFNWADSAATGETNGNTASGLSTMFADQGTLISANSGAAVPLANNLLPFRIISLANYTPDGSNPLQSINGNDYTSAYNRIVVGFNNSMQRGLAGI